MTECSVAQSSIAIHYAAELSGLGSDAYEHKMQLSPGLQVSSVELLVGALSIRASWSQTAGDELLITQHEAPLGDQQLRITARLPLEREKRSVTAPQIDYASATHRERRLHIFRQPDVRLTVASDANIWTVDDSALVGEYKNGRGRLAQALHAQSGALDHPPLITVEPNEPQISGFVLSRVAPGDGSWGVEIEVALDVQRGLLDTLRFDIPPSLDHSLTITPAVEHEIVTVPLQAGQLLLIRPQRALAQSVRLSIQGHIRPASSPPVALPMIALHGIPRVKHLVALPVNAAGQRFEWETSGMQALDAAQLPADLEPLAPGYDLYDVVAPHSTALGQVKLAATSVPQVPRADHRLHLLSDGQVVGTSRLVVLPRGARNVDITLPPNCRLLKGAIDGVRAQLTDRGGATWRFPNLGSEREHQIVLDYVAASSQTSGAAGQREFQPPSIRGASIGEVVWDVEPTGWSPLAGGGVRLPGLATQTGDWRLAALVAIAAVVVGCWMISGSTRVVNWLVRLAPLWAALIGAGWIAAGPWPWLGWLAIGLALWLAIRSPWPRSADQQLSSVRRFAQSR